MKPKHTPPRSVRVADDLWDAAKKKASSRDETVSDVVNRALQEYVTEES